MAISGLQQFFTIKTGMADSSGMLGRALDDVGDEPYRHSLRLYKYLGPPAATDFFNR